MPDNEEGVGGGDGPEERPLAAAEHEGLRPEVEQAEDGDAQAAQGPVQPGGHRQPLKEGIKKGERGRHESFMIHTNTASIWTGITFFCGCIFLNLLANSSGRM